MVSRQPQPLPKNLAFMIEANCAGKMLRPAPLERGDNPRARQIEVWVDGEFDHYLAHPAAATHSNGDHAFGWGRKDNGTRALANGILAEAGFDIDQRSLFEVPLAKAMENTGLRNGKWVLNLERLAEVVAIGLEAVDFDTARDWHQDAAVAEALSNIDLTHALGLPEATVAKTAGISL